MRSTLLVLASLAAGSAGAASMPNGLPEAAVAALATEVSGDTAKRNLEGIVQFHRERGSRGFHSAAVLVAERARAYGLAEVEILQFPADGKIFYGTQRSRPAWDVESAELVELAGSRRITIASYASEPIVLAEDSESADVTAELVDVGDGSKEADYAGKDVKGKIVLVASSAGAAQAVAVGTFGAVGIVSYQQNQKTAWSGDNQDQIRWGHLDTFSAHPTFAFMVSSNTARGLKQRLAAGERIRLHASVKAGQHAAAYEVVTAVIRGADPKLKGEEIAFSCHLDHQKPGANDNASGCVTILEVARTLQKLISEGTLARPARTIRFIWPPEIEGTVTLLNARPDFAARIKAVVHMDMVGGGPATQAVFHVTRGPASLPSLVHGVAWNFAQWVNEQSYQFAASGKSAYPMVAAGGGKEPLRAESSPFSMGSDHQVYQDSSFAIPAIYFNDWPDRYIHTNLDSAANIDATKLGRVAFIGAATGYALASDERIAADSSTRVEAQAPPSRASGDGRLVFVRNKSLRGPMSVFGYDYFSDHAKAAGVARPRLLDFEGPRGSGGDYAYEALNFTDGKRNAQQICDALSAEFGPVPLDLVVEYLKALEATGVVTMSP